MGYTELERSQKCPVRLGLIGSGWMGAFHAESAAQRLPGVVLEAIADPAPGAADALAARLGVTKATADVVDILYDPAIDGVIIAAPAMIHASLTGRAAAAGKHIFCEKPAASVAGRGPATHWRCEPSSGTPTPR